METNKIHKRSSVLRSGSARLESFRKVRNALICIGLTFAFGCITVNVNFPESAIQKAADDFVKDLYGSPEKPSEKKSPSTSKTDSSFRTIEFFTSAYAVDYSAPGREPRYDTPNSHKYVEKLKSGANRLSDLQKNGVVGEGIDGDLVIRDEAKATAQDRKYVDETNDTRKNLFEAAASDNQMQGGASALRRGFSKALRANAHPGTWIETEKGWERK